MQGAHGSEIQLVIVQYTPQIAACLRLISRVLKKPILTILAIFLIDFLEKRISGKENFLPFSLISFNFLLIHEQS